MSAKPLRQPRLEVLEPLDGDQPFPLPFTMAFQPIVDAGSRDVFAYEALVRGAGGEGALEVLAAVDRSNRRQFDQQCRTAAIAFATALGLKATGAGLSINVMPNAVDDIGACCGGMQAACDKAQIQPDRIIFEFTEDEPVEDQGRVARLIRTYHENGFRVAIDDFGAGHSGLALLARLQPDIIKLDRELVRGLDEDRVRRAIVASIRRMCDELGIVLVAEGIETPGEYACLRELGVSLLQGFLFARPEIGALPKPAWPALR